MKIYFNLMMFCICLLSTLKPGLAQQSVDKNLQVQPKGCERNNVILEQAHKEAGNSIVILVGRPGINDKKVNITEKRLYTSHAYLTKYLEWRNDSTLIISQSKNNGNEYGVVEIYIRGLLFDSLASYPDRELGLGSCDSLDSDDDESRAKRTLLYPWLYKTNKKLKLKGVRNFVKFRIYE